MRLRCLGKRDRGPSLLLARRVVPHRLEETWASVAGLRCRDAGFLDVAAKAQRRIHPGLRSIRDPSSLAGSLGVAAKRAHPGGRS